MKFFKKSGNNTKIIQNYLILIIEFILILSIINGIIFHVWQIVSTNIFLLILCFIPQILKKSYKIIIPKEFEWVLLIFVVISLFIGKIGGIIVPLFFGIIMSLIGFMILMILYLSGQIKKNYFLMILFAFSFAIVFGFGLEFVKYYLKIILEYEITLENYNFSMKSMTFIMVGAGFSCLIGFLYMKTKNKIVSSLIDKFKKENPKKFDKQLNSEEILEKIKKGENEKLEFKSTLRVNLYTNEIDKKIEHSVLKTINAFLNSHGGIILLGVSDKSEILGIEKDRFENTDKLKLHLISLIKDKLGKRVLELVSIDEIEIQDKKIIEIEVKKSNEEIFLKMNPKEEEFYVRSGPSTTQLTGSELVDYFKKGFREKKGE
jgi:hypothetical protein